VTVTVPVSAPGGHGGEELLLDPLDPLELPQHMLELELLPEVVGVVLELELLELVDDCGGNEVTVVTLDPELPMELEPLELPHDTVGLSRRSASRCRPKAEAICGSTVISRTKLATAITGTCARRRQVLMSHLAPVGSAP
jgi:hypothetical protein